MHFITYWDCPLDRTILVGRYVSSGYYDDNILLFMLLAASIPVENAACRL